MKKLIDPPVLYSTPDVWMDPKDPGDTRYDLIVSGESGESRAYQQMASVPEGRQVFLSIGESVEEWKARRERNKQRAAR